jgi:two-component system cell cycle response regulator
VESALKALRLGAHDFLTKPPSRPGEIAATVEKAVEKKRLREENRRLMREMEAMSRTDALTGLLNRRAFQGALETELARIRRNGGPLALVLFDIDHFKAVNDTHGHPAGDAVLAEFGRRLANTLRTTDLAFRFGGEEFAALLPDTTLGGGYQAADRVLEECRRASVPYGDVRIRITVSAGVAAANALDADAASLLARADRALYHAKRAGRDRAGIAGTVAS